MAKVGGRIENGKTNPNDYQVIEIIARKSRHWLDSLHIEHMGIQPKIWE